MSLDFQHETIPDSDVQEMGRDQAITEAGLVEMASLAGSAVVFIDTVMNGPYSSLESMRIALRHAFKSEIDLTAIVRGQASNLSMVEAFGRHRLGLLSDSEQDRRAGASSLPAA